MLKASRNSSARGERKQYGPSPAKYLSLLTVPSTCDRSLFSGVNGLVRDAPVARPCRAGYWGRGPGAASIAFRLRATLAGLGGARRQRWHIRRAAARWQRNQQGSRSRPRRDRDQRRPRSAPRSCSSARRMRARESAAPAQIATGAGYPRSSLAPIDTGNTALYKLAARRPGPSTKRRPRPARPGGASLRHVGHCER